LHRKPPISLRISSFEAGANFTHFPFSARRSVATPTPSSSAAPGPWFPSFRDQLTGVLDLVRRELRRPTDMTAPALCRFHSRAGAFRDQGPLKFRQCAHNVEHQLAACRRRVDSVRQRLKPGTVFPEMVDKVDEEAERPAEPVQLPHDEHIPPAGLGKRPIQPVALDINCKLRAVMAPRRTRARTPSGLIFFDPPPGPGFIRRVKAVAIAGSAPVGPLACLGNRLACKRRKQCQNLPIIAPRTELMAAPGKRTTTMKAILLTAFALVACVWVGSIFFHDHWSEGECRAYYNAHGIPNRSRADDTGRVTSLIQFCTIMDRKAMNMVAGIR
jgi:hypothetical protein